MNRENQKIVDWNKDSWPQTLLEIPQPPKKLRIRGEFNNQFGSADFVRLCVVGPRKHSEYAELVCKKIISGLSKYPISIVSGLAYGIDSIAHQTALENNIHAIAIPGSGLADDVLYPQRHLGLAHEILNAGGCLISEFDDDFHATNWTFPQRNRIMVGISEAVLIIETSEKSGTMITARLATDYNKEVMTVPNSIFSENSTGSNKLLRDGAHLILESDDVLEILGFENVKPPSIEPRFDSEAEIIIYNFLNEPKNIDEVITETGLSIQQFNIAISMLEIKDLIQTTNGKICKK